MLSVKPMRLHILPNYRIRIEYSSFSDSDRAVPAGWGHLASVRPGVPPEGIMAEVDAWLRQYPDAWLAVDMRVGVIPPAIT